MKFLDQVFLDNTIRNYMIVAIIILLIVVLKRIISKYVTALIFNVWKTRWEGMFKQKFDYIFITPIERILMVLTVIFSLGWLNFPHELEFSIHNVSSRQIVDSIITAVVIICIVSLVIRFMDFLVMVIRYKSGGKKTPGEYQLIFFFKDFIRVIIIIFGIIFILKYSFKVDIGNLLTGLSIVGAALALSARESLENLIASFVIFFDKPFETGDTIKVNNVKGTVERIGLRSTRVRTAEKTLVTIPNKQMVDSVLDNWSERDSIRNEIKIQLSPTNSSDNLEKAIRNVKEILALKSTKIISHAVHLQEISTDGALIIAVYFTEKNLPSDEINQLLEEINLAVKKMLEDNEITSTAAGKITQVQVVGNT